MRFTLTKTQSAEELKTDLKQSNSNLTASVTQ